MNAAVAPQARRPVWQPHWYAIGTLAALTCGWAVMMPTVAVMPPFDELMKVRDTLLDEPGVRSSFVAFSQTYRMTGGATAQVSHQIAASIKLEEKPADGLALANRMARRIVDAHPDLIAKTDMVAIALLYGYDMGIASSWQQWNFTFTPDGRAIE